jgi:hypothetical protein
VDPILFLAADDGGGFETFLEIGLFLIIAIGSVISAIVKKSAEKRQQEQAQRKAREAKEILARRTQREQTQHAAPPRDASLGTMKKTVSLREFVQRSAATPPPPPKQHPKPSPSMFAAPPKPVPVEESHLVEMTPIEHLPSEEEMVHSVMPSHRKQKRKVALGDLVRKRQTPKPVRLERDVAELHDVPQVSESNIHTRVNLLDPATARAAIIFQEILSPPKALRGRPELWD